MGRQLSSQEKAWRSALRAARAYARAHAGHWAARKARCQAGASSRAECLLALRTLASGPSGLRG
eukprot:4658907-Alexandrium_andersonii.AAC.1